MKFTGEISKIDEQGVMAKEDNPIPRPKSWHEATTQDNIHYDVWEKAKMAWQEAEANRKEYDVSLDTTKEAGSKCPECKWVGVETICHQIADTGDYGDPHCPICHSITEELEVGDRIEGDIINNEIVNVKYI